MDREWWLGETEYQEEDCDHRQHLVLITPCTPLVTSANTASVLLAVFCFFNSAFFCVLIHDFSTRFSKIDIFFYFVLGIIIVLILCSLLYVLYFLIGVFYILYFIFSILYSLFHILDFWILISAFLLLIFHSLLCILLLQSSSFIMYSFSFKLHSNF